MSEEICNYGNEPQTSSLTKRPETELLSAQSVAIAEVKLQVAAIKQLQQDVMIKDVHYGVVPGCGDKPTLLKAGAEKLALTFRIASDAIVEDLSRDGNIRYRVNCRGTSIVTGKFLGSGVGECSSDEDKYKWKKAYQNEFNQTPEKERRKISKYNKTTKQSYDEFQVRQNPANIGNTILKMAKKRAFVDLMLTITGASDMFAQDIEDMAEDTHHAEVVNPPYPPSATQDATHGATNILPPAPKGSCPAGDSRLISEAQGKRLYAIAMASGQREVGLKVIISAYGYTSIKQIEKGLQYEEICRKAGLNTIIEEPKKAVEDVGF